jgi:protein-tyrosine phosphatase
VLAGKPFLPWFIVDFVERWFAQGRHWWSHSPSILSCESAIEYQHSTLLLRLLQLHHILFVCTGNVFRSLTAEYALRNVLGRWSDITVASAGTEDYPHVVVPFVRDYLLSLGLDVSSHRRRTLSAEILNTSNVVIAMSTEHRLFLAEQFNRPDVPLFTEACGIVGEPLPDVEEAVADFETNPAAVADHVHRTIDRIVELTPKLAARLSAQGTTEIMPLVDIN